MAVGIRKITVGKKKTAFILSLIIFLSFFLVFIMPKLKTHLTPSKQDHIDQLAEEKYHLACPYTKAVYLSSPSTNSPQKIKAAALIVPHHLLAKDLINQALENLRPDYQTIILLGPNHYYYGSANIQTSSFFWKTKFGELKANKGLVEKLASESLVQIEEEYFNTEHSICALVSFLKIHFPKAKVIPLILKANLSQEEAKSLAQFLAQNCPDCLLLCSLDFSHDVSQAEAERNDQKSIEILTALVEEKIDQVDCDSISALQILFSYLKEKGINQGKLINQSDSFAISGQNPQSVTSYVALIYP